MSEEMIFAVDGAVATTVPAVSLAQLEMNERQHLQEWVLRNPEVLGPGTVIVTSEYDRWQSSAGEQVRDRLDVLRLDPDGRLVVAELKRGVAPHSVHMQAINYAAMVSRLTPRAVAELYVSWRPEETLDIEAVLTQLEIEHLLTANSIRNPRIVLVATAFPVSVTASVVWLGEREVDISLVRFRPYRVGEQVVVTFSRFYPVPSVEDFTVGRSTATRTERVDLEPGPSWDASTFSRLATRGNLATLTLLDLLSAAGGASVSADDVIDAGGITVGQFRGQLAGLTMMLRNKKNGFMQNAPPWNITWLPGGVASYTLSESLATEWRAVREVDPRMEHVQE